MTTIKKTAVLYQTILKTPLGAMQAIANHSALHLLEFVDKPRLEYEIHYLKQRTQSILISDHTPILDLLATELQSYFAGELQIFKTPLTSSGSTFQQSVWQQLSNFSAGQTTSYAAIAHAINQPTAYRAVAQALGANQLALIIPCHRVINSNGTLGGYSGGLARKAWLLNHEKQAI